MTVLQGVNRGDIGETRVVQLTETDGRTVTPADLTAGIGVVTHIRLGRTRLDLPTEITVAATGVITIDLGTAPTAWLPARPAKGDWQVQYEVEFFDGSKLTFPNVGYDVLPVQDELDAP